MDGFTRLSKGLTVVLVLGYLVSLLLPWTVDYLALVPVKTIPFLWNLFTAGFLEKSIFGLIVSSLGVLYSGKLLEPMWTAREFLKFVIFVNVFTMFGVYGTAITFYYATSTAAYLYVPLSGFHGVLSGFLVGVKQVMPDHEIIGFGGFSLRAEWLPSLFVLMSVILSFITPVAMQYLPFILFGTYGGWLYIRYFQKDPHVNYTGYPGDDFSFSAFFPPFTRPVINVIASVFHKILCKHRFCGRTDNHASDGSSLPVHSAAETSRWRERGARALESRLQGQTDVETPSKVDEPSVVAV